VTRLLLSLLLAQGPQAPAPCPCPCARPGPGEIGVVDPYRTPLPSAYALNREGRELYRTRRWEEARAKYRAALAADPEFFGPRLNVACSFAQEERFGEAVREAAELVRRAFVPWGREVREAADLAPLRGRREMKTLEASLASAGAAWGQPLADAVLFVARTQAPVRLPPAGVLYLGLGQEIFAWLPASGRYRQVTAEDGRVLAFVRSGDGRKVTYLAAGKLVRTGEGPAVLRGLTVRTLDLPTMLAGPAVPVAGDVLAVSLAPLPDAALLEIARGDERVAFRFAGERLEPLPGAASAVRSGAAIVRLDGQGVLSRQRAAGTAGCAMTVMDTTAAKGLPAVKVTPRGGGKPFLLAGPWGAGLGGLPFP
jgi:hypothetical protein